MIASLSPKPTLAYWRSSSIKHKVDGEHKLDATQVVPALERRFSPARLLRWELAWANGISWKDHEIKRFALERMYLLLVGGEHRYIHHDAEVHAIKQLDVLKAVLELLKMPRKGMTKE
jgi:hypothetical protein